MNAVKLKMNESNKRKDLTYSVQSEVCKKFKNLEQQDKSVQYYRITDPTYYLVIKQEPQVRPVEILNTSRAAKQSVEQNVEDIMTKWYQQARDRDESISGKIIQEKAHFFHEKIGKNSPFKASSTWLHRFRTRIGYLNLQKNGQKNFEGIQQFSKNIREKIVSENVSLENVYNADESGINWKVPDFCTTSIETSEMKAFMQNVEVCDRVTSLFCSNASGNHQLPLLIIGENEAPDCLKDLITDEFKNSRLKFLRSLNVIYTHQSNAWMNKEIFILWYKYVFIPNALNHQIISNRFGKILLILDNASCHPDVKELNAIHKQFEIVHLASFVSSTIQPMEQNLMLTTIKMYKKKLLISMFKTKLRAVEDFWNNFTLKDCLTSLSSAWASLNSSFLRIAWSQLLGDYCDISSFFPEISQDNPKVLSDSLIEDMSQLPDEICDKLIARHSPGADCSIRKLQKDKVILVKWFKVRDDLGWEPLTDDEIVNSVLNRNKKESVKKDDMESGSEGNENSDDILSSMKDGSERTAQDCSGNKWVNSEQTVEVSDDFQIVGSNKIASLEAFAALMKVKKWLSSCDKSSPNHHQCVVELENLISKYC